MNKVLNYFLFVGLCIVYFTAGYILGFYHGTISAHSDRINQLNELFDN